MPRYSFQRSMFTLSRQWQFWKQELSSTTRNKLCPGRDLGNNNLKRSRKEVPVRGAPKTHGPYQVSYAWRIYTTTICSSSSVLESWLCLSKSRFPFTIGLPCWYPCMYAWLPPISALPQLSSRVCYSPVYSAKRRLLSHLIMIFVQGSKILTGGGAPE